MEYEMEVFAGYGPLVQATARHGCASAFRRGPTSSQGIFHCRHQVCLGVFHSVHSPDSVRLVHTVLIQRNFYYCQAVILNPQVRGNLSQFKAMCALFYVRTRLRHSDCAWALHDEEPPIQPRITHSILPLRC
ncbi:hypothetical protein OE88DRAFT_1480105 [Heliocybe sulcata]|uniref:Uncharacterized protein n=1 Tax=Heliocybe sulcata TaxID=5364 RepID=A0A5C3N2C4_9AGAM|nr:hypothetical protein OE88DRAFT_1480105 [Heliocybe sulcata]